jgi:hypothetical protein
MTDTINQVEEIKQRAMEQWRPDCWDIDAARDDLLGRFKPGDNTWEVFEHLRMGIQDAQEDVGTLIGVIQTLALSHPAPEVPSADEVEQIRARHVSDESAPPWERIDASKAHTDRASLLRLLDAARAQLAGVREAAGPVILEARLMASQAAQREVWKDAEWVANSSVGRAVTRLAAALKDPQQ